MVTCDEVAASGCMISRRRQGSSYLEGSPVDRICYARGSSVVVLTRDIWVVAAVHRG